MPGTISASVTVSQPFSNARVSVSASAATVPTANKADADARPGRGGRPRRRAPGDRHRGSNETGEAEERKHVVAARHHHQRSGDEKRNQRHGGNAVDRIRHGVGSEAEARYDQRGGKRERDDRIEHM